MDTTLELHGRATQYRLHDDVLAIGERDVELAGIARVRLATLAKITMCELTLRDGTTATIANEAHENRAGYGALIRELHTQLATREGVEFVRGAWLLVGLMAGIGVLALATSTALWQGWITPPAAFAGKAMVMMIAGAAWVVIGPLLVWRSRPRAYDPRAVPAELVD